MLPPILSIPTMIFRGLNRDRKEHNTNHQSAQIHDQTRIATLINTLWKHLCSETRPLSGLRLQQGLTHQAKQQAQSNTHRFQDVTLPLSGG